MKNIFILGLLFGSFAFAETELKTPYDLDKDGVMDRFEFKSKGHVVRIEEDRNADKKIDFITHFNNPKFYRVEEQDQDFNGKMDRKQSFESIKDNKTKLITEVDKDGDGTFEISYSSITENDQRQENCEAEVKSTIDELTKVTYKAVSATQKGMIPTGLGYKVDHACYTKWGYDFNKVVKASALGGLQCLQNLDKKGKLGKQQTGALRNAFKISQLFEGDKISLVCSESKTDYDWAETAAHASSSASNKPLKVNGIKHPFVSLNPTYPLNKAGIERTNENRYIQGVIFHETLHNLGYLHDESIEFPYACESCCFNDEVEEEQKEISCRICTGNYTNISDPRYVSDVIALSSWVSRDDLGVAPAVKFSKENPKTTSAITLMALAHANGSNPIGPALAGIIEEKNLKFAKVEDAIQLSILKEIKKTGAADAARSTKVMAQAIFDLYYSKNGAAATKTLFDNRWLIKTQIQALEASPDQNKKNVGMSLRASLTQLIDEMWLNNYPDEATSEKASELNTYFTPVAKK